MTSLQTGLTAALRKVLDDNDWHREFGLVKIALGYVRPAVAIRSYLAGANKNRDPNHRDAVWIGTRFYTSKILVRMGTERRRVGHTWEYRWRPPDHVEPLKRASGTSGQVLACVQASAAPLTIDEMLVRLPLSRRHIQRSCQELARRNLIQRLREGRTIRYHARQSAEKSA